VFAGTVAALAAPRRLFPVAVVVVPLLALQRTFSYEAMALPVGMLMCAAFLLVAPTLCGSVAAASRGHRSRAPPGGSRRLQRPVLQPAQLPR
jgi:hypothetical protein